MKTNKQFIDGIYKKYDEHVIEKQKDKQRNMKKIINIAAVFIVIFSSLIVFADRQIPKQIENLEENEEYVKEDISLDTVGDFENFYNVIKTRYASNQNEEMKLENDIIADSTLETKTTESSRSTTNTQVENVDESDIVKVDDRYIYYITMQKIVIIDTQSPQNSDKIAEINYEDENLSPRELYVKDEKLIVIANEYNNICKTETRGVVAEDVSLKDMAFGADFKNKSGIIIYDITNIKEPKEIRRVMIEGTYISSRMIGDNVYFVANKNIYGSNICKNQLEDLEQDDYKPRYIDTNSSQEEKCIDYNQIYLLDGTEETNYLMLAGVNVESDEDAEIKTFLGSGHMVYASEKSMYIATNKVKYGEGYEVIGSNTHIVKFAIDNGKFTFVAEGDVDGQINNQFSMDENGNTFRVATTTGNSWSIDKNTSNNLYVLNEKLEEIGKITGFAQEEKIYSVRYVGDKAYVVTFKQTDPLFVIDLSVPSNPQILGELKLPGYSTYLHPYDETHIIGFGYETKENGTRVTTDGLKMVMFDVSDLANPQVLFKIKIGNDKYMYSELLYNHKSLLFSKEKNIIAFPLRSSSGRNTNSRAAIYEIDLEKGFIFKGEIGNINNDYNKEIKRIVFVNNTYYTLSNSIIKVADMESLEVIKEIEI